MSRPAARATGGCRISAQTRARTLARAIRRSCAGPISSKARQHVAGEATDPNTSTLSRSTSMSRIALPTVGDHHGQIDQHPTPIVHRPPVLPSKGGRQRCGQPGPVGQHPQQRRTHVRHHTRTVRGDRRSFDYALNCTPKVPPSARERFDTVSFPYGRGSFAYLHAADQPNSAIIANHPG